MFKLTYGCACRKQKEFKVVFNTFVWRPLRLGWIWVKLHFKH